MNNPTPLSDDRERVWWAVSACDDVREALERLNEAEYLLEDAKESLRLAKESFSYSIEVGDLNADALANLYWYETTVPSKVIAAKLGVPLNAVAAALPWNRGWRFHDCEHYVPATSRTKLDRPPHRCPTCVEQQKPAQEKERRQQKDAAAEEVARLRSMPYGEYLKTEHWKEIRYAALRRAGFACQACSAKINLNVHHRDYDRRGEERPNDVTVLCRSCHGRTHHKIDPTSPVAENTPPVDPTEFLASWEAIVGAEIPEGVVLSKSLAQWQRAGVVLAELEAAMRVDAPDSVLAHDRWRYFCGVVWRKIDNGSIGLAFVPDIAEDSL